MRNRFFHRSPLITIALLASTLALSGCGGDSSGSSASGATSGIIATAEASTPLTLIKRPTSPAAAESTPIVAGVPATSPSPTPASTPPNVSPNVLAFSAVEYSVTQSLKVAVVSVNRSGTASAAVSVEYATSDGSGSAGTLYTPTKGLLQWAANDTTAKSIVVPVNSTAPFNGVKSFVVALSNPSADAALSNPSSATVTVAGDGTSSVQLSSAAYSVTQNAGSLSITVTRTGVATNAVSVAYATASGTATAGTNYTSASGTLQWNANDTSNKTFSIAIKNSSSLSKAVSFNVALSAPSGGTALGTTAAAAVTINPVTASTTTGAAKVLSYLGGLNKNSNHRVVSGQHADIWTSDLSSTTQPLDVLNPLLGQTGANPGILGLVLNYATDSYAYSVSVTNTLANQWWSKGGLVMLSLYSNDPTFSFNSSGAPVATPIPGSAFHSLTDKSSAAYAQWHLQLDTYAAALHTLTDSGNVVLFRPFIEINGNWNWYGAENPADFISVWQDMHDYLTNTKGVKNLLWIYNVNQDVGNYSSYYPGSSYVDIVGMDIYNPNPTADSANATMYSQLIATGKPLMLPEVGLGYTGPANYSQDNTVIINAIRNAYPNVMAFVVFNGSFAICNQNNASGLMNDSWLVNLADLAGSL